MKAFLSYKFGDDTKTVLDILNSHDVEVFDSMTDVVTGRSLQKAIKSSISECDFVVIIYASANPNLAFEAGVAVSLNKPIFSIISEEEDLPDFLFDSAYVNATPSEHSKIDFNLKLFLNQLRPKKHKIVIKKKFYGGGQQLASSIEEKYPNFQNLDEQSLEKLFQEIIFFNKVNVVKSKFDSNVDFFADFCIWSDSLTNILGNPILIEIKREINKQNLNDLVTTFSRLTSESANKSSLVFYNRLRGIEKRDLPNSAHLLFIQFSDLIENLHTNDFEHSIRNIRNQIVHNRY